MKIPSKILDHVSTNFNPGQQEVFVHCREDSPKMYVKLCEDGNTVLTYCHHCSEKGYAKLSSKVTRPRYVEHSSKVVKLPKDINSNIALLPVKVRKYIYDAGVSESELIQYGVGYSEHYSALILPVFNQMDGELIGYQARPFDPDQPKYITRVRSKQDFYVLIDKGDSVCIVEDMMSAIRIGRHMSALCLLGVGLSDTAFIALAKYNKFYVWLDNDTAQVMKAQNKIKKRLEQLGTTVLICTEKDPKEHSDEEIAEILS